MTRKLIASILALSMAFTGFATAPARADEDVAKVIAGIAALVIISKAIEGNNNRQAQTSRNSNRYDDRYDNRGRDHRRDAKILPRECQDKSWQRGSWFHYYGARCLQRNGNARSYPQACLREIRTDRGWRDVYSAHCLGRQGFRVARNNTRYN